MFRPLIRTSTLLLAWACSGRVFAVEPDTFSKVVSFQYESSLDEPGTTIQSKVASFQYFDKLDDADLTFATSATVSFYRYGGEPVIVSGPVSQSVKIGTALTLSVTATGDAPLSYQWRRNGVNLTGSNSASIMLTNVQASGAGSYAVSVSNVRGTVNSANAAISMFQGQTATAPTPPTQTQTSQTLPAALTEKRTRPVSSQLRWFNQASLQFTDVPSNLNTNRMTVVITHGWNDGVALQRANELATGGPGWIKAMALALNSQTFSSQINIMAWDWGGDANLTHIDPAPVALRIVPQGSALGAALLDALGASYQQAVHFIGHSFGTGVNCTAANYVHGDYRPNGDMRSRSPAFDPSKSHLTLLDEAELATAVKGMHVLGDAIWGLVDQTAYRDAEQQFQDFWLQVIPNRHGWIDNYVSEVGFLHASAANVLLFRKNFVNVIFGQHGYGYDWYTETIKHPETSLLGHGYSYERGTIGSAPAAPCYYRQSVDLNSSEMLLIPIGTVSAEALSWGRLLAYPTEKVGEVLVPAVQGAAAVGSATYRGLTATGNAIVSAEINAVNYAGNLVVNTLESFSAPVGRPVFLSNPANTTPAYFQSVQPQLTPGGERSAWDLHYSLTAGGSAPFQPSASPALFAASSDDDGLSSVAAPAAANVAYMILPVHVPLEATALTFEYKMVNAGADDFMTLGIGTENLCSIEAAYVEDGSWTPSPALLISDHRDEVIQLVFAFNGTDAPPVGTLNIRNIQFYIPPRPALSLGISGQQMNLSWPLHGIDWTLETTTDLTQPNSWQPVLNSEAIQDYQRRVNLTPSGPRQFFRLRK